MVHADAGAEMLAELGASRSARPSESAIRRAFTRVDADILDAVIGAFCWTRTRVVGGRRVTISSSTPQVLASGLENTKSIEHGRAHRRGGTFCSTA